MRKSIPVFCLTFFILFGCVNSEGRARPDANEYKRTETHAFSQNEKTKLAAAIRQAVHVNKGKSGFRIFERGSASLTARLALIQAADKSLDLQYYAVADDKSSNLVMEALIRAAQRGVRVRLLVDSFTVDDMKEMFMAFSGVPNLEIRVFNPVTTRDESIPERLTGIFTDLGYADKRMHNKALIADNQLAIMGGRNLSDEYFDAGADLQFRDLDVLAAGPVTDQISKSFDRYWNDKNSFPVSVVYKHPKDAAESEKIRQELTRNWEKATHDPKLSAQFTSNLPDILANPDIKMIWAEGELAADDPGKITKEPSWKNSKPLNKIISLLDNAHHSFIVFSAYFVPKDEGVEWLNGLEKRGIHTRILTNSLASTDVVAVHTGYAPYRVPLLKNGIELFELMPASDKRPPQRLIGRAQPPRAGLHTKAYVIDAKDTVIGSFNLDPRSTERNTEMTLIIHSPEISAQMERIFSRATSPEVSYQLILDESGKNLRWQGIEKGQKLRYAHDPHSGLWRNFESRLFGLFPLEDRL